MFRCAHQKTQTEVHGWHRAWSSYIKLYLEPGEQASRVATLALGCTALSPSALALGWAASSSQVAAGWLLAAQVPGALGRLEPG